MNFKVRRRILLSAKRDFIIFQAGEGLLEGSVKNNSGYSSISSNYLSIQGSTEYVPPSVRSMNFSYSAWTEAEAISYVADLYGGGDGYSIGITDRTDHGFTITIIENGDGYYVSVAGYITIGSYDFTKYKILKFNIANFQGAGKLTCGGKTLAINGAGEYLFDIEDMYSVYDLKFECNAKEGYVVTSIALET